MYSKITFIYIWLCWNGPQTHMENLSLNWIRINSVSSWEQFTGDLIKGEQKLIISLIKIVSLLFWWIQHMLCFSWIVEENFGCSFIWQFYSIYSVQSFSMSLFSAHPPSCQKKLWKSVRFLIDEGRLHISKIYVPHICR